MIMQGGHLGPTQALGGVHGHLHSLVCYASYLNSPLLFNSVCTREYYRWSSIFELSSP